MQRESFEQKILNPQAWQTIREKQDWAEDAANYISRCLSLEAENQSNINAVTQAWLDGLEKYRHSPLFLEHIAIYFYRTGKYHKALEFCKKATDLRNSTDARKTAIAAAFAMGQYHLVWDNFLAMEPADRDKTENDLLSRCARAALELQKFTEAEKILQLLGRRQGATPLPDLKSSLLAEFGNEKNLHSFMKEMAVAFSSVQKITEISIRNCILYAGILIHYERYDEASKLLEKYRAEYLAAAV